MSYNSLQAVLQKQMSHGLQYQVSYTYSKCMSDSTGYYGAWNNALSASAYWQNVYDQRVGVGAVLLRRYPRPVCLRGLRPPFGRGKSLAHDAGKAVNAVIGGWQSAPSSLSALACRFPSMERRTLPEPSGAAPGRIATASRDYPRRSPSLGRWRIQWFTNDGDFTQPGVGTFGNCAAQLGYLRSPHYTDVDMSLHKNFQLTERFNLQFRTDFINAFNHVQLNAPNMHLGPTMGQITTAQPPRNIQLALKLYF